jgi:hypothetical protein
MALRRKKAAPVQPRREPTLAERTSNALSQKDGAESLVRTGLAALDSAADNLEIVALDAQEEAARVARLAETALEAAEAARIRVEAVRSID